MVRKNSLASDFITSATFGLAAVCAIAGKAGRTQTRAAAAIMFRRIWDVMTVSLVFWVSTSKLCFVGISRHANVSAKQIVHQGPNRGQAKPTLRFSQNAVRQLL